MGRPVGAGGVAALLDVDADVARSDLDDGVGAGLLRRSGDGGFDVVHSLINDTAVRTVEDAASLHRRAAELIGDDDDRLGERAQHLLRGGPEVRHEAVKACCRAAEAASAAMAHEEAIDHYQRALGALDHGRPADGTTDRVDTDGQRLDLLLALGRAQRHSDHRAAADDTFDRAGELAAALGDTEGRARAALRGAIQYYFGVGWPTSPPTAGTLSTRSVPVTVHCDVGCWPSWRPSWWWAPRSPRAGRTRRRRWPWPDGSTIPSPSALPSSPNR
jgi:tetratricopeptide (TPR) repeat protein